MTLCQDCLVTVHHEGEPNGTLEMVGGVETYVAIPTGQYDKTKAVLFLPDVYGHRAPQAQLLADDFARCGFQVYVPDYLNGDPVTPQMRSRPEFDLMRDWLPRHTQEYTRPTLDKVISSLKGLGIETFGSTGYCFGGRYGVDLATDNIVAVSAIAHPGLVDVGDFVKLSQLSRSRFLVVSCEDDFSFPMEMQAKVDEILGSGKYGPGYDRKFWPSCRHGFAVRPDPSNPTAMKGKEEAFQATVEWFRQYL